LLLIQDVVKRYGALTALNGVSLQVKPGEFFGLLGPNGAGKSTLMSLVAGLRAADAGVGRTRWHPRSPRPTRRAAGLGLVPQNIALYQELSADQNLNIFGKLYGLGGSVLRETRPKMRWRPCKLTDRRRDQVKTFSGGMQRRLNLAAAFVASPKLLLCDEPTVRRSTRSRATPSSSISSASTARAGRSFIRRHYMEEATRLCSRIGIIDHGSIPRIGQHSDELLHPVAVRGGDPLSRHVRHGGTRRATPGPGRN